MMRVRNNESTTTTGFFPLKEESLTGFLVVVDSSSKSGAISPTARLAALEMRDCNFNGAKADAVKATSARTTAIL